MLAIANQEVSCLKVISFNLSKGRWTRAAEQLQQQLQRQRQPGMGHKIFRPHFADEVPPRV